MTSNFSGLLIPLASGKFGLISTPGKGFEEWLRSILNQLWWSSRTSGGDPDLLVEKWKSILYHACNIHEWPDDPEYKLVHKCDHTPKGIGIACPTVRTPKPAPSFDMVKNDSHMISISYMFSDVVLL